ncbi:alcohol dehydrogenase, putative [Talaromyces stipitatus ATCC 10500]|uniref:Alcohol dehydrogenase, putative n=1 Tax=Talaromyces stipitatus (strain ATCC 10500 / CBS 375.48 / QM 6759 / NRRL 1006) TaxID=441959 RepID=B8MEY3_TALSN|nr:alcohol dehydrogenase, putative [Talaromyces stipitatus ATCC 10500]EED17266.1 alcohol dehydrogenase, putative [Talaromyces stipitatus ATCC 10500]
MAQSQTAVRTGIDGSFVASHNIPVPSCSPDALLVKVYSVALNPSDYKMARLVNKPGLIVGCDFAGEIVEIGCEANRIERPGRAPWVVGDRVCGAVHGSNSRHPAWGAFAQFVEADPAVLLRIPTGWNWHDAAAVGGSCVGAVGLALFCQMGLSLSVTGGSNSSANDPKKVVLVYGGSSACGTMALQVLKAAGYTPIAVCSPHNNSLAKSYGAVACFDYHSPQCAQQVKAYTRNSLSLVLDCIGTVTSMALCYEAIGRAGGRYVSLEKLPAAATSSRPTVRSSWAMGPLMFGRRIDMGEYSFEPDPAARDFGRKWYALVEELVESGQLRAHPVQVLDDDAGSWVSAVQQGLQTMQEGKISGVKLVVSVAK